MFEIKPANPYPDDYEECTEVAKAEKENNERPELASLPDSIEKYDRIYIGYPIWWHTVPMVIGTFLESCDLCGPASPRSPGHPGGPGSPRGPCGPASPRSPGHPCGPGSPLGPCGPALQQQEDSDTAVPASDPQREQGREGG